MPQCDRLPHDPLPDRPADDDDGLEMAHASGDAELRPIAERLEIERDDTRPGIASQNWAGRCETSALLPH
jgi:hypothetical protein